MVRPFLLLLLHRPSLAPTLLSAAWTFREKSWYRKAPFLPLPSEEYMRWRMETAYGDPKAVPPPEDMAQFLTWSADMRRKMRTDGSRWVWLKVGCALALVGLAAWVNIRANDLELLQELAATAGYPGLFAAAVASGFNVVPLPVISFFPALLETGFSPLPTLATIVTGMTLGDLVGYMIGSASRGLVGERLTNFRARIDALHQRHRLLPLLLLFAYAAFVPLPNELLVIPLAFMGYSLTRVMIAVLCGNMIFNTLMALLLPWLFSWIGG